MFTEIFAFLLMMSSDVGCYSVAQRFSNKLIDLTNQTAYYCLKRGVYVSLFEWNNKFGMLAIGLGECRPADMLPTAPYITESRRTLIYELVQAVIFWLNAPPLPKRGVYTLLAEHMFDTHLDPCLKFWEYIQV